MINMFFFLKFKSQLRRTRSFFVRQVDESFMRAIIDAGGKITGDRFVISAVFNEDNIGFWLDMYILIENMKKNIEDSKEFFGYSLLISSKIPDSPELLCRFLAHHSGVFVDDKAGKNLLPYASFEEPSRWMKEPKKQKYDCGSYYRISELKIFKPLQKNKLDFYKDIIRAFEDKKGKHTLIVGPYYLQMNCGLKKYCSKLNGHFPALTISFESIGIGALVDIWSPGIRTLEAPSGAQLKEDIDNLWEFLFRERLRSEIPEYIVRCTRQFLLLVFDFYLNAARIKKHTPVLALENIHLANKHAMNLLLDTLAEINSECGQKLLILGAGENSILYDKLNKWKDIFESVMEIEEDEKPDAMYYPKLSTDLWEIIYAISLFSRCFSPELFLRLFEEDGRNPEMIKKAFSILHALDIIDNIREPRLIKRHFAEYACKILEDKAIRVKALFCGRLLDWASRWNINPCFRMLTIIAKMDGIKQIDDLLLLKSFFSDIVNNTTSAIENAVNAGQFEDLFAEKAAALSLNFKTTMALVCGNEKDIEKAFNDIQQEKAVSDCEAFPIFKAQIILNLCSYYLGRSDEKEAAGKAKEVILLGQKKTSFCLPQAYRLFALVCLSKQQINETIEYLGFALVNAEKNGNYHELAVSTYYAAAAQFLYGDVYSAARFARKSIEHSLFAGLPDWADRSRFLEGRLEFDLGHYSKALDIFENLFKKPCGCMSPEKQSLLAAWIYRSKIYFQDPRTPKPQPANHDADLFEIEAAYLAGDFKKAVELSSSCVNPFAEGPFMYIEQADWRSGFAQCEHLFFTIGEIQNRLISLFHSLSLSCLLSGDKTDGAPAAGEDAMQIIQQILRDEKLCEIDPWDAYYFFAKYRILEQSGASLVDMSTAVSMAFKRLQRRAGRIENSETRQQYLNGSRWNRELGMAAKEFKLI